MHNPLHWPDTIYRFSRNGREQKRCIDIVNNFSREIILQREAELVANNFVTTNRRHSLIDVFLKEKHCENPTMTLKAIQEEVNSFIFAGHDTTGVANSWACQLIGSHPEVQKKLHEEIDRVLGKFDTQ
jgi:cytochrome P450 family 4 subfamily V